MAARAALSAPHAEAPTQWASKDILERHFLALVWPACLRSRSVEFAVLAPIVFGLGWALATGI